MEDTFHEYARHLAGRDGLMDQITFEVASSKSYPANRGYDLVTFFDCLHDMGDPVGASAHVLSTAKLPQRCGAVQRTRDRGLGAFIEESVSVEDDSG